MAEFTSDKEQQSRYLKLILKMMYKRRWKPLKNIDNITGWDIK